MSVAKKIQAWEEAIESGRRLDVAKALVAFFKSQDASRVPDALSLRLAQLCRRVDLAPLGVRSLYHRVRGETARPTTEEKLEFGLCLTRIRADEEGNAIFKTIDPAQFPRVLLYRSFFLFSRWDYEAAIPLLERFCQMMHSGESELLIGQVNLASAYVGAEQCDERVERVISTAQGLAQKRGHRLFLGNLHEIRGNLHLNRREWSRALDELDRSEQILGEEAGRFKLYCDKWRLFIADSRGESDTWEKWQALRTRFEEEGEEESVRHCDLLMCVARREPRIIDRLFFGTPFLAFRSRVQKTLGYAPPAEATIQVGPRNAKRALNWNVDVFSGPRADPIPEGLLQNLFQSILRDLYVAPRLSELHARVYSDRHYHPIHSPQVLHQNLKRLRHALKSSGVLIKEQSGSYKIESDRELRIRFHLDEYKDQGTLEKEETFRVLSQLREDFESDDLSKALGLHIRKAQRILRELLDQKQVTSRKIGRSTRYTYKGNSG